MKITAHELVGIAQDNYKGKNFGALRLRIQNGVISFQDVDYCPPLQESELKWEILFFPIVIEACETFEHVLQHIRWFSNKPFQLQELNLPDNL